MSFDFGLASAPLGLWPSSMELVQLCLIRVLSVPRMKEKKYESGMDV